MKKFIAFCILCFCLFSPQAYEIWTPAGITNTVTNVNPATGKPALKQDLIDSPNSGQPNRAFGFVFGRNPVVNNVRCTLWEGPTCMYVFPAAAQQMAVSSTSTDDALAGTGIQKIKINYLDAAFIPRTEIVSLNGTTPVNTVATNIYRINGFYATQVGSNGVSVGAISLKNVAGTITYAFVNVTNNSARQAVFTIPAGVSGYISHWQASSGAATGQHFTPIVLAATSREGIIYPGIYLAVDEVSTLNNAISITLPIPIRVPATADVIMVAISDAANANATAMGAIMGWFEPD